MEELLQQFTQCTPTVIHQHLMNNLTVTKKTTELTSFQKTPVFQKNVWQQTEWFFYLSETSGIDVTTYDWVSFQQRDWVDDKLRNIDRFYRTAVTSAQCKFWTEKFPETGINLDFTKEKLITGYAKMCFVSSIQKKKIHFSCIKHRKTTN